MIKVTMTSAAGRKSEMFAEHQTPRDVFKYFDVDYSVATNSIDGVRLGIGDMDKSLKELGVGDECRISSVVKIDNAALVTISGASAVVESEVALDDWKRVEKYAPEMLKIVDEDTDETLFRVMTGPMGGSINKSGVVFGAYTNSGKATVTILLDDELEDKVQVLKDAIGSALLDLNAIEKEIPTVLKDIEEKEAEIEKLIVAK